MNEIEKIYACCVLKVIQCGYDSDMNNKNPNYIGFSKGLHKKIYVECGENYVLMHCYNRSKLIETIRVYNDEELNKVSEKIQKL